ncbi:hypothetical protein Tco_0877220 [Tanacetum coccineum]|uniref:Uncharacterized protein n=1 Tax=Tanacetum coccineum TaxID=301880 RepID=A0ABQ5BW97_9ASTR
MSLSDHFDLCEKRLKDSASFCEYDHKFRYCGDAQIGNNVRPLDPSKVASEDLTTGDEGASCFSCALPDAPIGKMYQPSWDGWERCILTLHTLAQLVGTCVNMFNLTKLEHTLSLFPILEHTLSLFLEEAVKGELESLFVDKVIANLGDDNLVMTEEENSGQSVAYSNATGGPTLKNADIRKLFIEALRSPFTRRIIEFSSPTYKMPNNVKIYDGSEDLDDHISRLAGAVNLKE